MDGHSFLDHHGETLPQGMWLGNLADRESTVALIAPTF